MTFIRAQSGAVIHVEHITYINIEDPDDLRGGGDYRVTANFVNGAPVVLYRDPDEERCRSVLTSLAQALDQRGTLWEVADLM